MKRTVCASLAGFMLLGALCGNSWNTLAEESTKADSQTETMSAVAESYMTYAASLASGNATDSITLDAVDAALEDGTTLLNEWEGVEQVVVLPEKGAVEWTVTVTEAARYQICVQYYPLSGRLTDIEFSLVLDGALPFREAEQLRVSRSWALEHAVAQDNNGNDIRPGQVDTPQWMSQYLQSNSGYVTQNYVFYFSEGSHTLRLTMTKDTMALKSLVLGTPDPLPTYEETLAAHEDAAYIADYEFRREAEDFSHTSNSSIYASNDRGNAAISPSDPAKVRLNVIGLDNWSQVGQWVSWEVTVPEDGWYHLYLKYRQNAVKGFATARRLYIEDKVPFVEANSLTFPYTTGQKWVNYAISDAEGVSYAFYLEKGTREIKLEVVSAPSGELLEELSTIVTSLNSLYREIIMITGTSPDTLRDYYLDQEIPGLQDMLNQQADKVDALLGKFKALAAGGDTSQVAFLKEVSSQLRSLSKRPETIQTRLDQFRTSISSMSDLILSLQSQPLELDYLTLTGENVPEEKVNAGFFENIAYRFQAFLASFVEDYNSIGNTYEAENGEEPLEVWVTGDTSGRDQLTVCKSLIDNDFIPEYGISVNVNLVSSSATLTQAILAGSAPDCALMVPSATPINLAMRNALVDLSKMEGFEETREWYHESALIPYVFEDGVYAMPESQVFWMMFYRSDILTELNTTIPDTWEEFYAVANVIMKSNLKIGIPENQQIFETFLMQNGAQMYTDDWTRTRLDEQNAITAFTEWTDLYVNYGFDTEFDALSRFRTGEMPIIFHPYNFYNQLAVAAPEISGLWDMAPLPAREIDGEMSRISSSSGTGSIILKSSTRQEDCWTFLRWWCGEEAQSAYGTEIEAVLGASARYNPANRNAFEKIGWSADEKQNILDQWQDVSAVYNVPGNYYVSRCLTNAFRQVTIYFKNPRETLAKYNQQINAEVTRKRKELGLAVQ